MRADPATTWEVNAMKILLHGCNGKMGQVMTRIVAEAPDVEIVCGVDAVPDKVKNTYPVYRSLGEAKEKADVVIDFSHHSALDALLAYGKETKIPLVICTTGFSADEKQRMAEASKVIPILNSANMSLGVNLLLALVKQTAPVLAESNFDIEIVEKHHNQKLDSPSGTALMIADAINSSLGNRLKFVYGRHSKTSRREPCEIGIHAIRGGAIVGEHTVIFAGQGEVIEITHSAISRDVFAYGALRAARFVVGAPPGFYGMDDVLRAK